MHGTYSDQGLILQSTAQIFDEIKNHREVNDKENQRMSIMPINDPNCQRFSIKPG
jgi:hypothetical protein